MPAARPLEERIAEKFEIDADTGCWLWTAFCNPGGYGKIGLGRRNLLAHRAVYELVVGRIPEGLQLDHLCRVRHCVNPDHLEVVTSRENTLRGETLPAHNAAKTHCEEGHELGDDRVCRECARARARRWKRNHPGPHDTCACGNQKVKGSARCRACWSARGSVAA